VLPWQPNFAIINKNCTDFSYIQKYKDLRSITVMVLVVKKTAQINVKKLLGLKQCKY